MTAFDETLRLHTPALRRRLERLLGDPHAAEDAVQEALVRAWRSAPRDLPAERLGAWLHRCATNVGLDELRRRARRPTGVLDASLPAPPEGCDADARAALEALTPHQRFVLLARFEAGLSLRELGEVLDIGEDAARKRVARAREAFAGALAEARRPDDRPTVAVLLGEDDPDAYRRWLGAAGARVRMIDVRRPGLDLAGADALVLSGSATDVHPRCYGAALDPRTVRPDLTRDLRDLAALRSALAADLPVVGVCRGAQLLSVLFGGALAQHVDHHDGDRPHAVRTASGSAARRALGASLEVVSDHHQAVASLGRPGALRVTGVAPDGTVEAVEVPGRRLALGTQWHPERGGGGGQRLAELLVEAAGAAA